MHLVVVAVFAAWLPWVPRYDRWLELPNSVAQVAALLVIWAMIRKKILFRIIPN